eukprot:11393367-Ditylum_brightwellii.AAC.1
MGVAIVAYPFMGSLVVVATEALVGHGGVTHLATLCHHAVNTKEAIILKKGKVQWSYSGKLWDDIGGFINSVCRDKLCIYDDAVEDLLGEDYTAELIVPCQIDGATVFVWLWAVVDG